MLIRSQDKRKLTNLNQVSDIVGSENIDGSTEIIACYSYFAESDCGYATLGKYSNKAKALKVMDMICNRYQAIWDAENGYPSCGSNFSSIFQMPQDGDVAND